MTDPTPVDPALSQPTDVAYQEPTQDAPAPVEETKLKGYFREVEEALHDAPASARAALKKIFNTLHKGGNE